MFVDSNHVPNPVRGCMFIDTGPTRSSGRVGQTHRECSLTNAAGRGFLARSVYKHATPDGVGSVIGKSSVS